MTEPDVLLTASGVSKTFGGNRALDQVGLEIRRGEIHALVGENGSGKSTLIKILAGYYVPDPGSVITVAGRELPPGSITDSTALGLRFVHQHLGLVSELNAADNIGLVAGYATGAAGRVRVAAQRQRAAELLGRIGMSVDLDVPVGKLRPVERSAVAIARALATSEGEISLLVLDEPTAALPPTEVDALFRVVRDVAARGVSVLYVSHRLDEILALASVVSVLRDGRHQGTFPVAGLSREDIVGHILGTAPAGEQSKVAARQTDGLALSVRDLSTRYLRQLDFDIRRGEIVGVAGLDGSGRDELASALGGALDRAVPATGTIIDARRRQLAKLTARQARKHGIALVLPNWHPAGGVREFDVRENVSLASLRQFSSMGIVRRSREQQGVLDWLSATDVRPRDPAKGYALLSGGNQQKVIIARWLATTPDVLVLDDPTSGVDVGARHQIYDLIRAQAARGVGVLLCSSDLEDLVSICDRVLCLVEGRVVAEVSGEDITEGSLLTAISGWRDGRSSEGAA